MLPEPTFLNGRHSIFFRRAAALFLATTTVCVAIATANAQDFPQRPIKFVVPFAAGGSSDVIARVIAQKASEKLGQTVYVENRPGAGGTLGTDAVVRSAPDGYTWLLGTTSTLAINSSLYKKLTYKVEKDLAPVSMLAKGPFLLMANPSLPIKTLRDAVQYSKERPNKVMIASSGYGTSVHLSAELFKIMAGVDLVHVPYKGGGPALMALIAGDIQFMINDLPPAIGPIQSGQVRAIAIADTKRSPLLPDVPTFAEAGMPDYVSLSWFGLLLPKDTPAPIISIVRQTIASILVQDTEIKAKFETLGVEPISSTPEELDDFARAETKKWHEVIKSADIQLN